MSALLRAAAEKALEALIESVDLVQDSYDTDWRHGLPTRAKQLQTSLDALNEHKSAINGLRAALAAPQPEPLQDGWTVLYVKNFDAIASALERADRQGYLPDACADEWLAFDYRLASPPERDPLTEEQAMRVMVNASDSLNITRVHELGGKTRTICDEAGLMELARAIERAHGIGAKP